MLTEEIGHQYVMVTAVLAAARLAIIVEATISSKKQIEKLN